MSQSHETRLRLTKGDYGIPLSIYLAPHCSNCGAELLPADLIVFIVERAERPLISKSTTWRDVTTAGGYYTLSMDKAEADELDVGLYTWRIRLVRNGVVRHTLATDTLEVVP